MTLQDVSQLREFCIFLVNKISVKYFFIVTLRRAKNTLSTLRVNGTLLSEPNR